MARSPNKSNRFYNNNLFQRVVSAVIAAVGVVSVYAYLKETGLIAIIFIAALICLYEFTNICFDQYQATKKFKLLFFGVCAVLLLMASFSNPFFFEAWGLGIVLFFSSCLWLFRNRAENEKIFGLSLVSSLGFIYCAFFPALIEKTVLAPNGPAWFFTLICLVFFGDIFAYFGGKWLGKTPLMPQISPKKTVAGSVAGFIGSLSAGLMAYLFIFEAYSLAYILLICFLGGFFAQTGDLFVSLLKRIANVKDSGKIMPGHGGLLDRLDGVYFAAPIIYLAAHSSHKLF